VEKPGSRKLKRSHYRILGLIGQGQFGRVYCASHRQTGQIVALKELDPVRFPTHKFLREMRFLVSLAHPNIVTLHGLEHSHTVRYIVMDYCESGTLRSLMQDDVRLHPAQSLRLVANILAGIEHAHSRNIIHCDIKPENILLTLTPDGWTARISDFGIARLSQELSTPELGQAGSPAYMAPERFYGEYSFASDIYAVGILLFELLAGYRPFSGIPSALMVAHLNQPLCIPDTIPPEMHPLIQRSLQKLPARRFRSAAAMLEALQTVVASLFPPPPDQSPATWLRPVTATVPSPFQAVYTAPLPQPIQFLFTANSPQAAPRRHAPPDQEQLYQVSGGQIQRWDYSIPELWTALASPSPSQLPALQSPAGLQTTQIDLPAPIQAIALSAQGCVAIADRTLYHLQADSFIPTQANAQPSGYPPAVPVTNAAIAQFTQDTILTTDPEGRWVAVAADAQTGPLQVSRLRTDPQPWPSLTGEIESPLQIMGLDSRYLAAFCQQPNTAPGKSRLHILNRRGRGMASQVLPVSLQTIIPTPTPYRLLATESGSATSVLLIELKPWRMVRIGVEIVPKLLAATEWGYILMAEDGGIVLVNHPGQIVGRIAGPPSPTAIAPIAAHGLAIATWQQGQGHLHIVDLRQIELDMVF
jgi:serine/threonine protein kinase